MTETRDKIVEAMSRAACIKWGYNPDQKAEWLPGGVRWKSWAPSIAAVLDAALAALPKLGLAIVSGLNWKADAEGNTDNALFIGGIFVGYVTDEDHQPRWRAWLMPDFEGNMIGSYSTRDEARAALMARARKALGMDREPLGKEE